MLIVANWKAYVDSLVRAKKLVALAKRLSGKGKHELVLAAPTPYIGALSPGNRSKVTFAAQDLSISAGGAETGEVTAAVLRDLGISYVILGHSERRAKGETDQEIAGKVERALAQGIAPILCIGERERDEDAQYLKILRTQIAAVYEGLSQKERLSIVIAYEPVWAIGKTAADAITPQDLGEMALYIRKILSEYLSGRSSLKTRILYGGSVEPQNARDLLAGSGVDGFLIGHASVDEAAFEGIVRAIS